MFSFRNAIFPIDRELRSSLQVMSGIGYYKSFLICAKVGFSFPFSMSNLNFYFFTLLSFFFKGLVVSSDKAKRKMSQRMKILLSVKS
jgi:ribosomal protein S13